MSLIESTEEKNRLPKLEYKMLTMQIALTVPGGKTDSDTKAWFSFSSWTKEQFLSKHLVATLSATFCGPRSIWAWRQSLREMASGRLRYALLIYSADGITFMCASWSPRASRKIAFYDLFLKFQKVHCRAVMLKHNESIFD